MTRTRAPSQPRELPRFVLVGPGALGSVIAAHLARAGVPVTLLGRPSPHLEAIRNYGLRLEASDGAAVRLDLAATDDPRVVANADVLLVLVKTGDTAAAMSAIAPYVRPDHVLVTLQNGLGGVERIRATLGGEPCVLPGVTWQAATRLAPGVVRHAGSGPTAIGYHDNRDEAAAAKIAATLSSAGLPTTVVADIEQLIWQKAAVNAAINGLTALGEFPNGAIAQDPALLQAAAILAEETARVARARGTTLAGMDAAVFETAVASAHNRSSMLQDLEAGRRTEVEAIHGEILRAAAELGIAVPALTVVTALIRSKERAGQEMVENNERRGI